LANHKSSEKRARQSVKRQARNTSWKSKVKTFEKKVLSAVEKKDITEAKKALVVFMSQMDRAAQKGVYHVKKAARKIGRISKQVSAIR
jgi:small subunit ribosomal protein S20